MRRGGLRGREGTGLVGMDNEEESRRRYSSTFRHSAWRAKGIVPLTLQSVMSRSLENAMSRDGLKHCIECSYPRALNKLGKEKKGKGEIYLTKCIAKGQHFLGGSNSHVV